MDNCPVLRALVDRQEHRGWVYVDARGNSCTREGILVFSKVYSVLERVKAGKRLRAFSRLLTKLQRKGFP